MYFNILLRFLPETATTYYGQILKKHGSFHFHFFYFSTLSTLTHTLSLLSHYLTPYCLNFRPKGSNFRREVSYFRREALYFRRISDERLPIAPLRFSYASPLLWKVFLSPLSPMGFSQAPLFHRRRHCCTSPSVPPSSCHIRLVFHKFFLINSVLMKILA